MSDEQIKRVVLTYINKIKKQGIPITHVFIFGSRIKEKPHYGSDIDTCIISPIFGKDRQKERILLMNLREGDSDLIEPHPYSEKDFQNPFNPICNEIKKTGLKII
jgi:predicted nucleotidyltransferase